MNKLQSKHLVRYHLRVPLRPPHWREEQRALWAIIRRSRADEVMFFVPHVEEGSPGLGTDAENEQMAELLEPLFGRLRRRGIAPSINIYWTVGFSNFPSLQRDLRSRFKFRWAVGIDGRESVALACPLDPGWRAQVKRMYRTYAQLKPARLWIDDDVRMTLRADLHTPCFCKVCLGEMTRRTGKKFSRAEWVRAILADPPNPVRNAWLDFQEELERGVVGELARAVHEVSPDTQIGFMFSPLEIHWAEGRRWKELISALDTPRPYVRPNIGPYIETTAIGIASSLNNTRLTQAALPSNVVLAPEIENYPQTRFMKSAALDRADMILAQLMGIREVTFSLHRPSGRMDLEVRREQVWERTLGETKPMLEAIARLGITLEQSRGVSLVWHEEVCRHARGVADESKPIFLYRERPWDHTLPLLGIATRYGPGEITALAGEQVDCLDESQLDELFSRGVLLDARAAESLLRMGRGELAGLVRRTKDVAAIVETVEDAAFGDLKGDPQSCRWLNQAWQFDWAKGARVVSRLRDYEGHETGHGLVLFANRFGGRIALFPFDSQTREVSSLGTGFHPFVSPSMLTWTRQSQFRATLEWLGRTPLPLFVAGAPSVYPLLVEQEDRLIVGVANLSPDAIETLTLQLRPPAFPIRRVHLLRDDGSWRRAQAVVQQGRGGIRVHTKVPLPYLDVAVLRLE